MSETCGCDDVSEGGLTRRRLLALAGLTGAAAVVGGPRLAFAATPGVRPVLIVVMLRGGFDGLTAVVPHADPAYYAARPTTAIPQSQTLDLDGRFGLHPALAPLMPSWRDGSLAVVHAVGHPNVSRSHFAAQDLLERGVDSVGGASTGWLARHLAAMPGQAPVRGISLAGSMQRSLHGPVAVPSCDDTAELGLHVWEPERLAVENAISAMHVGLDTPLARATRATLTSTRALTALRASAPPVAAAAAYPATDLGRHLRQVAELVKVGAGLECAAVELDGWDHHEGAGTATAGRSRDLLAELGAALAALRVDLGPLMSQVTIATVTEFGRRLAENGSSGTDHGYASAMLVMGGGIRGGRVHGAWPGLAPTALRSGDLAVRTDVRDVLAELLVSRLRTPDLASVFPGHRYQPLGITTGAVAPTVTGRAAMERRLQLWRRRPSMTRSGVRRPR